MKLVISEETKSKTISRNRNRGLLNVLINIFLIYVILICWISMLILSFYGRSEIIQDELPMSA